MYSKWLPSFCSFFFEYEHLDSIGGSHCPITLGTNMVDTSEPKYSAPPLNIEHVSSLAIGTPWAESGSMTPKHKWLSILFLVVMPYKCFLPSTFLMRRESATNTSGPSCLSSPMSFNIKLSGRQCHSSPGHTY